MCEDIIFTLSSKTMEGYPVIGAGVCDVIYKERVNKSFSKINEINLNLKDPDNLYETDYLLNGKIGSLAPDYVHGLVLSIDAFNIQGPTGGIIGNPNNTGITADGLCNSIGNGFSIIALPGGPGMLIEGTPNLLKSIFTNIVLGQNRLVSERRIMLELRNNNINLALIVTDGTGECENGMILTYCQNRMEKLEIDG